MKILICASNMVHINNFHRPYIDEFKRLGHEAYIMASGEGADFDIPFKKRSLSLKNALLSVKIKKIIKREKFDVVYLHTTLAAFWVRLALKGVKNRPIVVNTVHGYLFGGGFGKLHNKLYLSCERLVKKQTDYIFVMNNEDEEIAKANSLAKLGVYKINGMGLDPAKRIIEKASPTLPPKKLVYVGELSKRKNQIFLVRALKHLENATLTLVGDGSQRQAIEKEIKRLGLENRVTITGFTKNVSKYLSEADMYVSASTVEGLPFNILEAMEASLPIVASNIKGQCDLLPSECLYESGNMEEFISRVNGVKFASYDISNYKLQSTLDNNMSLYLSIISNEKELQSV